jgi:hypothetical protein
MGGAEYKDMAIAGRTYSKPFSRICFAHAMRNNATERMDLRSEDKDIHEEHEPYRLGQNPNK